MKMAICQLVCNITRRPSAAPSSIARSIDASSIRTFSSFSWAAKASTTYHNYPSTYITTCNPCKCQTPGFAKRNNANWERQLRRIGTRQRSSNKIEVFRTVEELRKYRHSLSQDGRIVGLVPTMGALHQGHLSLAKKAAAENSDVFVSIYVNPTQFGINEDLDAYPRTLDADLALLKDLNEELHEKRMPGLVTAVFIPSTKTMYPTLPPTSEVNGEGSFVMITPLGKLLEGASRPVFFRGVATVCMKLFNIVKPQRVYFGQKDVQQSRIIRRLVTDFHVDTEVRIIPTTREPDGLAMSSRNVYLGSRRRAVAVALSRALRLAATRYYEGRRLRDHIVGPASDMLNQNLLEQQSQPASQRALFKVDYISLADPDTMEEINEKIDETKGAVLSGAMIMHPIEAPKRDENLGDGDGGSRAVRLIDNIILTPSSSPKL